MARFEPVNDEYRYLRADGTLAWLKIYWLPVRNQDGSLAHVQGYGSEITRTVEEAKENQALIEALVRSTAVIEFKLDGTVITANKQFLDAMGYSLGQIVGKHHRMFCSAQEAASDEYVNFWKTLNRGEYVANRFKRVDGHGNDIWLEATYNPVHDTEGKLAKVVKFASVVIFCLQKTCK